MRRFVLLLLFAFGLPQLADSQTCTGLCLQQVACGAGATTSISGTVYAPNGTDPLPNVLVFVPNAPLTPMTAGVSCPAPGAAPDGSPLVGTTTAADGTFHLDNVPVGNNIPLVIQSGRWRRQVTVPTVSQCADTAFSTRFARNQSEGDIPQFAVATGFADQVECVLLKVGIQQSEFTNPLSPGRIHLYGDRTYTAGRTAYGGGAVIDSNTPLQSTLTNDLNALKKYDVLMLPCEGGAIPRTDQLNNFRQYADAGGRVYASHYAYTWLYQNKPFDTVVNWHPEQGSTAAGTGTINPEFYGASTLIAWLQTVGGSTTPGQVALSTIRHDLDGVNAPTQSWITLNDPAQGNPVMQFTFDTPVGSPNQCGRVLFNEYHVENRPASTAAPGAIFPSECSSDPITPQEKLLEYSLFDLTNTGGQPTLTPASADFGTAYIGFATAPQTFTWTNHSIFTASVSSAATTGDFAITGNTCKGIAPGASCTIQVVFKPTAVGPVSGTLTVTSNSSKLTSTLTGNGAAALVVSNTSLAFGNTDVGFPAAAQSLTLRNAAAGSIPLTTSFQASDFALTSTCGTSLAAGASCTVNVLFKPSGTGARTGQASFNGQAVTFTGNGVDFSTAFAPTSGAVVAGLGIKAPLSVLPIAGFSSSVQMSCSTTAPGSTCTVSSGTLVPSASAGASVQISTTSRYTVIGYGGLGTWKLAVGSLSAGLLLWRKRRLVSGPMATIGVVCLLGFGSLCLSGCGSKNPATNAVYTAPGAYTYTLTATDGMLVHTAIYNLTVTAK